MRILNQRHSENIVNFLHATFEALIVAIVSNQSGNMDNVNRNQNLRT